MIQRLTNPSQFPDKPLAIVKPECLRQAAREAAKKNPNFIIYIFVKRYESYTWRIVLLDLAPLTTTTEAQAEPEPTQEATIQIDMEQLTLF